MLDDVTRLYFPSTGSTKLPFDFEPQFLRCTAAGPGGTPLKVLLDTGTDPSAIDVTLARRLGLRVGEFALGQDALSDSVPFTETVIPRLRLGELVIRDLFALAIDLSGAPFEVDMVLGYNVLCRVVFQINYVNRYLRLSHPDLDLVSVYQNEPGGMLLPLTFFEHFPTLTDGLLCDEIHLPLVTIDTGSNSGLTLGPDLAASVGLSRDAAGVITGQGTGFSHCRSDILRSQVASLRLGGLALHNVDLDTAGGGAGDLRRAGRANMGNRLLSRFATITLDYERALCGFSQAVPEFAGS
jgi:hypothetical protein